MYEYRLRGSEVRVVREESGMWGWREDGCERKNSFFKYYNIKFFKSQEGWEEWGWEF